MFQLYCRTHQQVLRSVSRFISWREPETLTGANSLDRLSPLIREKSIDKLLIVTDQGIMSIGLMDRLLQQLSDHRINYVIYDGTTPNPTITNVEEATTLYEENECQAILAFGGGSPIDCAKGVAAKVAKPNQPISKMRGLLKVRKKDTFLIAVPTTAGTGSEATLAAVISNPKKQEKYAIMDSSLFPDIAVLDPALTVGLPPHLTATTGMDALTHAVEVYIGKSTTKETRAASKKAIQLIFDTIYDVFLDGQQLHAREKMLEASYLAGFAFTRSYVGNVHAIAHTLGGFYSTPHGLANAVILPYVLEYYGETVHQPLAELAEHVNVVQPTESKELKAKRFIDKIKELNEKMDLPDTFSEIQDKDLPLMVNRAYHEANPLYPVPIIFSKKDFKHIYNRITRKE